MIGHLEVTEDLKPTFSESEEIMQHPPPSADVVNVITPTSEIIALRKHEFEKMNINLNHLEES